MNLKQLIATATLSTVAMFTAPMAMADNDDYIYQQNQASYISHEKAGQIAQAQVKGSMIEDVEFEHSQYRGAYFDVELVTQNGMEYDVKVDAKTGKVLLVKQDRQDR